MNKNIEIKLQVFFNSSCSYLFDLLDWVVLISSLEFEKWHEIILFRITDRYFV